MELKKAIEERRSIRGFLPDTIDREILTKILQTAVHAPSGVNLQPWEIAVVTGKPLQAIKDHNMDCLHSGRRPDRADAPVPDGVYKERRKELGKALLTAMQIPREDREGRVLWSERGYRFFDAPAVIFLLMDDSLDETAYRLDMGCLTQNICLVAQEYGLGTCIADQAVTFQKGAREILRIPESKRFVIGIAIGYPDMDFPANHIRSTREDLSETVSWHGFDA